MKWDTLGVAAAQSGDGYEGWWRDEAGKRQRAFAALSKGEAAMKLADTLLPRSALAPRRGCPSLPPAEQCERAWQAIERLEGVMPRHGDLSLEAATIRAIGGGPVKFDVQGCATDVERRRELRRQVYWDFGHAFRMRKDVTATVINPLSDDPAARALRDTNLWRLVLIAARRLDMYLEAQAMLLFPAGVSHTDFAWSVSRVEVDGEIVTQLQLDGEWPQDFPPADQPDLPLNVWASSMADRWVDDPRYQEHWRNVHAAVNGRVDAERAAGIG